jgi:hypothetical protein
MIREEGLTSPAAVQRVEAMRRTEEKTSLKGMNALQREIAQMRKQLATSLVSLTDIFDQTELYYLQVNSLQVTSQDTYGPRPSTQIELLPAAEIQSEADATESSAKKRRAPAIAARHRKHPKL